MNGRWLAVLGLLGVSACAERVSLVGDVDGDIPVLSHAFYSTAEMPSEWEDAAFDGDDMMLLGVWTGTVSCEIFQAWLDEVGDVDMPKPPDPADFEDSADLQAAYEKYEDDMDDYASELEDLYDVFFPEDSWTLSMMFFVPDDNEIDEDVEAQGITSPGADSGDPYFVSSVTFREDGGETPNQWFVDEGELNVRYNGDEAPVKVEGDLELIEGIIDGEQVEDPDSVGDLEVRVSAPPCDGYQDWLDQWIEEPGAL